MSSTTPTPTGSATEAASGVVPRGVLKMLSVDDIKPSTTNPRLFFDNPPLDAPGDRIRMNVVIVDCHHPAARRHGRYPLS